MPRQPTVNLPMLSSRRPCVLPPDFVLACVPPIPRRAKRRRDAEPSGCIGFIGNVGAELHEKRGFVRNYSSAKVTTSTRRLCKHLAQRREEHEDGKATSATDLWAARANTGCGREGSHRVRRRTV